MEMSLPLHRDVHFAEATIIFACKNDEREICCMQVNDSYTVLLREKKLPLALLEDPEAAARTGRKTARASLTAAQPFATTFGSKQTRKRPKLSAETYGDLVGSAAQTSAKCVCFLNCSFKLVEYCYAFLCQLLSVSPRGSTICKSVQ